MAAGEGRERRLGQGKLGMTKRAPAQKDVSQTSHRHRPDSTTTRGRAHSPELVQLLRSVHGCLGGHLQVPGGALLQLNLRCGETREPPIGCGRKRWPCGANRGEQEPSAVRSCACEQGQGTLLRGVLTSVSAHARASHVPWPAETASTWTWVPGPPAPPPRRPPRSTSQTARRRPGGRTAAPGPTQTSPRLRTTAHARHRMKNAQSGESARRERRERQQQQQRQQQ